MMNEEQTAEMNKLIRKMRKFNRTIINEVNFDKS